MLTKRLLLTNSIMLKIFFEKLIIACAYLWSFIYTKRIKEKFIYLHYLMYYGWIKRQFGYLGDVYFRMPTYLGNMKYMKIGDGTCIGKRAMIQATDKCGDDFFTPSIIIGENCNIGDDSNIQCCNKIQLGNGVLLGRKVMINDTTHGLFIREHLDIQPSKRPLSSKGEILIEDNVWIGEMVSILGNVHIGKGAVIGAGSVVTKDIPAYGLAVGVPANVIKQFKQ